MKHTITKSSTLAERVEYLVTNLEAGAKSHEFDLKDAHAIVEHVLSSMEELSGAAKREVMDAVWSTYMKESSRSREDCYSSVDDGKVLLLPWPATAFNMMQAGSYIEQGMPCDNIAPYFLSIWCKLAKYILSEVEKGLKVQAEKGAGSEDEENSSEDDDEEEEEETPMNSDGSSIDEEEEKDQDGGGAVDDEEGNNSSGTDEDEWVFIDEDEEEEEVSDDENWLPLRTKYRSKGLKEAIKAFQQCYLPIIACFSKNKTVRKTKFEDHPEIPELFDQVLEVSENNLRGDLHKAMLWLQRMWKTVGDDHKYLIIEPSTRLGVVANVSGVSDLAQLQCELLHKFPVHRTQKSRNEGENTWMFYSYAAPLDEAMATLREDEESQHMDTFLSSEAAMDEVPRIFPGEEGCPSLVVTQGDEDDEEEELEDGATQKRDVNLDTEPLSVIILTPPFYTRNLDPRGVYHFMEGSVELLGALKEDQVMQWLRFFAKKRQVMIEKNESETGKKQVRFENDPQLRYGPLSVTKFSTFAK